MLWNTVRDAYMLNLDKVPIFQEVFQEWISATTDVTDDIANSTIAGVTTMAAVSNKTMRNQTINVKDLSNFLMPDLKEHRTMINKAKSACCCCCKAKEVQSAATGKAVEWAAKLNEYELQDTLTRHLKRVIDVTQDGSINFAEFLALLEPITGDLFDEERFSHFFDDADPDKSGYIGDKELVKYLKKRNMLEKTNLSVDQVCSTVQRSNSLWHES